MIKESQNNKEYRKTNDIMNNQNMSIQCCGDNNNTSEDINDPMKNIAKKTVDDDKFSNYLNDVRTFDELIEKIHNFNGCNLKRQATNTVVFDGNKNAKIMLIGEAPGESEDLEGKPFCGQSGKLLRKALNFIQLNNENLLITNTVFWRPPINRKPYEDEITMCAPFVEKMIDLVKPKVIILCGLTAVEAILKSKKRMSEVTGKVIDLKFKESNIIKIFPIYHPSYLLRSPGVKKIFWKHLLFLKNVISNL